MDGNSYPLASPPPEHGTLVPVSAPLLVDPEPDDSTTDLSQLWHFFSCLFWVALLTIDQLRRELLELRCQANYWRAQHERAVQREAALAAQVQQLQGELREWKRRFFGRKSETSSTIQSPSNPNNNNAKKRSRGQQPGSKGHGRRHHDHLATTDEVCTLPKDEQCCADCGQPFVEIPGTADGDILEIDVRAHRRRYHRCRYRCH
jgi:hypothetical protein